jgi:hypothetical protein
VIAQPQGHEGHKGHHRPIKPLIVALSGWLVGETDADHRAERAGKRLDAVGSAADEVEQAKCCAERLRLSEGQRASSTDPLPLEAPMA